MLADLPGYGYAKASKTLAAEWQKLIFSYLRGRASLRRVALLIDAAAASWRSTRQSWTCWTRRPCPIGLVLTKTDELTPAEVASCVDGRRRRSAQAHRRLAEIHAATSAPFGAWPGSDSLLKVASSRALAELLTTSGYKAAISAKVVSAMALPDELRRQEQQSAR